MPLLLGVGGKEDRPEGSFMLGAFKQRGAFRGSWLRTPGPPLHSSLGVGVGRAEEEAHPDQHSDLQGGPVPQAHEAQKLER